MSAFKGAAPVGVSTESWGELPMLEGSSRDPTAASARIPMTKTMGRSPALGDMWWISSNEDVFLCSPAQHT